MTQIVIAANGDKEYIVVAVFGGLYCISSLIQYGIHVKCHYDKYWQNNSIKFALMVVLNTLLLLSSWAYFAGDNMHIFVNQNEKTGIAALCLLFIGLTGFRLIPLLEDTMKKLYNESGNTETCITKTIIDFLQLVPEIDGWFTHFTVLATFTTCSSSETAVLWVIYGFILILLIIPIICSIILYCNLPDKPNKNEKSQREYKVGLSFVVLLVVALYLIGDNSQLIDCTGPCGSSNCGSIVRIFAIVISVIPYGVMLIIAIKKLNTQVAPS